MRFESKVERYDVIYHAGGERTGIRAAIRLFGQGEVVLGAINFHQDPVDLPELDHVNWHDDGTGHCSLHMRVDCFDHVLDLLRNEKPIYLGFGGNEAGDGVGSLATAPELIGEGE
jgi:hypothetical protein